MQLPSSLSYPAIIKFDGCDELILLTSESDWQGDDELLLYVTTEQDVLIDSLGQVFQLSQLQMQGITAKPLDYIATAENVNELIQAHFAAEQECCISKLSVATNDSVKEVIARLAASISS